MQNGFENNLYKENNRESMSKTLTKSIKRQNLAF